MILRQIWFLHIVTRKRTILLNSDFFLKHISSYSPIFIWCLCFTSTLPPFLLIHHRFTYIPYRHLNVSCLIFCFTFIPFPLIEHPGLILMCCVFYFQYFQLFMMPHIPLASLSSPSTLGPSYCFITMFSLVSIPFPPPQSPLRLYS